MRHNPTQIKNGLHAIANYSICGDCTPAAKQRETAIDALAYIRHLEGELRRQGFTDYTEKEEDTNG